MPEANIPTLLEKIRSICRECSFHFIPQKVSVAPTPEQVEEYLGTLEEIRRELSNYRYLQEEYNKLETLMQRHETDIRKRIGVEQQLKLYTDALKTQVEDLEKEKLELLENCKESLKQLKKTNEGLFSQLEKAKHKQMRSKSKSEKDGLHRTSSIHHEQSLRQIIKTEYIERERSHSGKGRKLQKGQLGMFTSIANTQHEQIRQKARTFQITSPAPKDKQLSSKKKHQLMFANLSLFSLPNSSKRQLRREEKPILQGRSSPRQSKRKDVLKTRLQSGSRSLWKEKKANRSIFSLTSLDHPHQKSTL